MIPLLMCQLFVNIYNQYKSKTISSTKGLGNLWSLEIERTKFVSPRADRPLLLSRSKIAGCKAHRSFTLIKSSQQGLMLIFEEY